MNVFGKSLGLFDLTGGHGARQWGAGRTHRVGKAWLFDQWQTEINDVPLALSAGCLFQLITRYITLKGVDA